MSGEVFSQVEIVEIEKYSGAEEDTFSESVIHIIWSTLSKSSTRRSLSYIISLVFMKHLL